MSVISFIGKGRKLGLITLVAFFCLLIFGTSLAQKLSTGSKKAAKLFESAETMYQEKRNAEAAVELLAAIEKDPGFVEAHVLLAAVYTDLSQVDKAIESYKSAVQINPGFFPPNYYNLGTLELTIGDYVHCKEHLLEFLKYKGMRPKFVKQAAHNIKVCDFSIEAMKNPMPFEPKNLGKEINSAYDEYYPGITADDRVLLYTKRIKDDKSPYGEQEDFFVSEKVDGRWTQCYNIGPPINTHHNEGSPTISPDGQIIIFAACEEIDGYGAGRTGFGSCDIFFVKKKGATWTRPVNMGPPISSKAWDAHPSYASDGTTLYFISNRKGSIGKGDIWVSHLTPEGVWGKVENLGPVINTAGSEESVFIHPDNQTLYFTSNGHVGMGELDIYVTRKDTNGEWGKPVNLGYPINTFNDENGLIVGASGELAFFSSNREGGFGGLDLYSFELPKEVRPTRVTYVKGKVSEQGTKSPLSARFELIDLETGKIVVESYSSKTNGEFLVCLPVNKNYALNVSKRRYVFYSENFSLKGIKDNSEPFELNVPLQPVKIGAKLVLKNVFYETGSYELKKESKVELMKLVQFMTTNSTVVIEISGHTDNVGVKSDNQKLSRNRAGEVYKFLIDKAVSEERMKFKGYGDTKPIKSNDTNWGRAQNRRTEFEIIEIK